MVTCTIVTSRKKGVWRFWGMAGMCGHPIFLPSLIQIRLVFDLWSPKDWLWYLIRQQVSNMEWFYYNQIPVLNNVYINNNHGLAPNRFVSVHIYNLSVVYLGRYFWLPKPSNDDLQYIALWLINIIFDRAKCIWTYLDKHVNISLLFTKNIFDI